MCPTGWSIFSKPIADTDSAVCLTDGIDGWGPQRAEIVKIFLCTLASNQLVCGSLPHNLRHCCRVVVPRDKVSPGKKQTFPSVCRHPIVSGQFGHLIPVKQLIKRALHPNRSLKMLTVRREGAAPHWWHKGVSAARRYALWTAVTQQSCALWLAGAWQPRVRCIQSPTSRQPREAGVLAQGKGNGKWFAIGR